MYPCSDLELWPMNVMILFWNDFMLIPIWYIFQTNILIISRDIKCSICQTNVLFSSFRLKKIWIWLNHHKGHSKRSEGQIWLLSFYLEAIFSKTVWFVLYLCRKRHKEGTNWTVKRWISFNHSKGNFSRSERSEKGQIWMLLLFANFLKSNLITFLYFLYTASLGWYWSTGKSWISLNKSKGHFQGRKGHI